MLYLRHENALTQLKIGLTQAKIDQTPSENLLTQIFGQVLVCPCRKSAEKTLFIQGFFGHFLGIVGDWTCRNMEFLAKFCLEFP